MERGIVVTASLLSIWPRGCKFWATLTVYISWPYRSICVIWKVITGVVSKRGSSSFRSWRKCSVTNSPITVCWKSLINIYSIVNCSDHQITTLATIRRSIDGIDFTSSLKCDTDWVLSDIIGQLCVLLFLSFIFFSLVHSDVVIDFLGLVSGLLSVHYGAF